MPYGAEAALRGLRALLSACGLVRGVRASEVGFRFFFSMPEGGVTSLANIEGIASERTLHSGVRYS